LERVSVSHPRRLTRSGQLLRRRLALQIAAPISAFTVVVVCPPPLAAHCQSSGSRHRRKPFLFLLIALLVRQDRDTEPVPDRLHIDSVWVDFDQRRHAIPQR